MADQSEQAPPLVWPPLSTLWRPHPPFQLVYLDLNHWISLAQANTKHPSGAKYVEVLAACRRVRAAQQAVFPLSNSHYVEILKITDPRQREDLAEVMQELSGFVTLISPAVLKQIELDAVLRSLGGTSSGKWGGYPLLGMGVGFAFGSPTQVSFAGEGECGVTNEYAGSLVWAALRDEMALMLERSALAGPRNDEEATLLRRGGWDSEALLRAAKARAQTEVALAERLDTGTWRQGRLRDVISAHEMQTVLDDPLQDALRDLGTNALDPWLGERSKLRQLVRSMPSSEVTIELRMARHRNPEQALRWEHNDVIDIDALSLAVPYCSVVVTEKHAHHVLCTAHLDVRMNTVLLRDLTELPDHLPSS